MISVLCKNNRKLYSKTIEFPVIPEGCDITSAFLMKVTSHHKPDGYLYFIFHPTSLRAAAGNRSLRQEIPYPPSGIQGTLGTNNNKKIVNKTFLNNICSFQGSFLRAALDKSRVAQV